MQRAPLHGIRVADFTWAWAGPYATLLLAFMGAEVIKIESSRRPDHARLRSLAGGFTSKGVDKSPIFNDLNLNKMSVSLDLTKAPAVELVKRLVAISDVVTENFRPGVMDRLGIGYQELRKVRPDILMLSSSAVGAVGPERNYTGFAPTFAALGGVAHLTGYPDKKPIPLMGSSDLRSAATSAFAILAGLYHRARSGEGQHIDLSSTETNAVNIGDAILDYTMNRRVRVRQGNRDDIMAPHNCYRCRGEQSWVSIAVATEDEWRALCAAMGNPPWSDDERFADGYRRWCNQQELDRLIEEWTAAHTAEEATDILQRAGVAAMPSRHGTELHHDPHLKARGFTTSITHHNIGQRLVLSTPWHFSQTPAGISRSSPLMGEHNGYVFGQLLGLSEEEIARLEADGVIA